MDSPKILDGAGGGTLTGSVLGSPAYMPPVQARPVGPFGKGVRWMWRHPLAAALAGLSFVMLMAVVVVSVTSAARIKVSRDAARARLAESLVSEARALRVAGEPGHRAAALERLQEAHRMDGSGRLEARLRQEVIATLSRPDLRRHLITNLPPTIDLMMVCLDPSFERAALWSEKNREAQLFQLSDGRCLTRWETKRPDEIEAFSADGKFVSLRYGGVHDVWDVANATRVLGTNGAQSQRQFSTGAFSPDGRRFARGEEGRQLGLYELIPSLPARRLAGWPLPEGMALKSLAWSPEGDALALILDEQTVAVCDATNGSVRWRRNLGRSLWNIKWNNRANLIVVQSALDKVLLLAADDGRVAETFNQPTDESSLALISEDGRRLVTSGADGGTRFLDLLTGQSRMADHASASDYVEEVYLWDMADPDRAPVRLKQAGIKPLFTADGQWLLTVGTRALLWRVGTWEPGPLLPLAANNAGSFTTALSRDGRWLAATQREREVHLIELATRRTVAVLNGPGEGNILKMTFSPDGTTLAIARQRGDIQLWHLPTLRAELSRLGLDWK